MKVNRWFWLRAFVMCIAFTGTVFAIMKLDRTRKVSRDSEKAVNLCPTRVTSLTVGDAGVVQDGMAWYRKTAGRMEELDPIAVEKWFGSHCVVDADPAEAPKGRGDPVATLAFVSGTPQELFQTATGVYTWMDRSFTSHELADALKALSELPIRLRPSR